MILTTNNNYDLDDKLSQVLSNKNVRTLNSFVDNYSEWLSLNRLIGSEITNFYREQEEKKFLNKYSLKRKREYNKARKQLLKTVSEQYNKTELLCDMCRNDYYDLLNDNILTKLDSCKDLYDDKLRNSVLNNQIELIYDYFQDYFQFQFDKRLANVRNEGFFVHESSDLLIRKYNSVKQSDLVDAYFDNKIDNLDVYSKIYKLVLYSNTFISGSCSYRDFADYVKYAHSLSFDNAELNEKTYSLFKATCNGFDEINEIRCKVKRR